MKRGYLRLLFFELILIIILCINSFLISILSGYKMILFLILAMLFFWRLFGFEKDRHRYIKDILLETIIFLFIFLIVYYLFGLIVGFSLTGDYLTKNGIIDYLIPVILYVLLKEFLRYSMVCKADGNRVAIVTTVIVFIFLDITNTIMVSSFATNYDWLNYIALTLLPAISSNIVLTYITFKVGYKPPMLYALIIRMYRYLIPIVPNPSPYIYSIIMLLLPVLLGIRIYKFYKITKDQDIDRDYNKKKFSGLFSMSVITIILVYFVSGYFRYHAIAVASGSMTPKILKGDVVVIDREDINYADLKEGTVIAFKKGNKIIVHRLVKKIEYDNEYILYTKGDANEDIDNFTVKENEVYGIVDSRIPYIGLPTVWLNKM